MAHPELWVKASVCQLTCIEFIFVAFLLLSQMREEMHQEQLLYIQQVLYIEMNPIVHGGHVVLKWDKLAVVLCFWKTGKSILCHGVSLGDLVDWSWKFCNNKNNNRNHAQLAAKFISLSSKSQCRTSAAGVYTSPWLFQTEARAKTLKRVDVNSVIQTVIYISWA